MYQSNGFLLCFGLSLVLSSTSSPAQTALETLHDPSLSLRPANTHNNELVEKGKENENTDKKPRSRIVATASVVGQAGVKGTFVFTRIGGWGGTVVEIEVTGLTSGAGYPYHIHEHKVINGDCSTTLKHFNPTNVTTKDCDYHAPKHCQAGDLAGKFGNLTGEVAKVRYYDSSLNVTASANGIVGRSVVIHDSTQKKIACGNIVLGREGEKGASADDGQNDDCT